MECPTCETTLQLLDTRGFSWCPTCGLIRHRIGDHDQDQLPQWTQEKLAKDSAEKSQHLRSCADVA